MPNTLSNQINEAAERLRQSASDGAPAVSVSSADLLLLLSAMSQPGNPGAAVSCDDAFAGHYKADPADPSVAADLEVWRNSWAQAQKACLIEVGHQVGLLGQVLGDCIVEAGIIRPGVGLTGPELLMFANDQLTYIKQQQQMEAAANAVFTFMLKYPCESPLEFLRCWNEGNFDALRAEWPEAPDDIYIGPDQFHPKTIGYDAYSAAEAKSLTSVRLLSQCRDSFNSDAGNIDALIAEVDAYLAGQPALANSRDATGGIQDELDVDGAKAQHKAAAQALIRAVKRQYPLNSTVDAKVGGHLIRGTVIRHSDSWWSDPGEFTIRNIATGKERKITHSHVKEARESHAHV
ncbi:hypothetical protein ACEPU1_28280 [Pseudomonas aeruginosa]